MTTLLFSTRPDDGLEAQLARLRALPVLPPFSPQARAFVADFARGIMRLPQLREFPELATLAHWFRPAALDHLAQRALAPEGSLALARGLVFHLAPANVDVLFAYAWLMSLLCGNANLARLSQKPGAQREALVALLQEMHARGGHEDILGRTVLLTYPHDDAITADISAACHARVAWGGDATVARIRAIPLAPLALELSFPDRFGVAAFSAAAVSAVPDPELPELARRFCNDVLWFGQQACSSPRCLYWIGEADAIAAAKARFWPAVRAQARQFEDETAAMMGRITDAHLLAATGHEVALRDPLTAYPLRLAAARADGGVRSLQSGHGLVVEVDLPRLDALAAQLDDRDQTLVQHGFGRDELAGLLAALAGRAIDRVVPVGRALDFHHVWDGTDLFRTFTRLVTLPSS